MEALAVEAMVGVEGEGPEESRDVILNVSTLDGSMNVWITTERAVRLAKQLMWAVETAGEQP